MLLFSRKSISFKIKTPFHYKMTVFKPTNFDGSLPRFVGNKMTFIFVTKRGFSNQSKSRVVTKP